MTDQEWAQVVRACVEALEHERREWSRLLELIHRLGEALEETLNKLDKCPIGTLNYAAGVLDAWREARRKGEKG